MNSLSLPNDNFWYNNLALIEEIVVNKVASEDDNNNKNYEVLATDENKKCKQK